MEGFIFTFAYKICKKLCNLVAMQMRPCLLITCGHYLLNSILIMKKISVLFVSGLCLIFLASSCRTKHETSFASIDPASEVEIQYTGLDLEEITLDSIYCSYSGYSGLTPKGDIFYYDKNFASIDIFSPEGKHLKRCLGYGRSNNESVIRQSPGMSVTEDGGFVIASSGLDFEVFDSTLTLTSRFTYPFDMSKAASADPTVFETYSFVPLNPVFRAKEGKLYFNLFSQNPDFNYVDHQSGFLNEARLLAVVDLEDKTIGVSVKGFPESYFAGKDKFMSFSAINFDFSEDEMFVGYEADSLIFVCDLSGVPKSAFGNRGKGMDTDYYSVSTWNEIENFEKNHSGKDCYSWIEYIDETGLLFRSYTKRGDADGLQIYKNQVLVADVEVPPGMKVIGYSAPYYYSTVNEDYENERLTIFRFRL